MHIFALVVEVCFAYKAASLRVLRLRLSPSLSPLIHSLRRQKLISPDICFQSEASSVLFPLCKPAIKGINLRAGEEPRENIPESAFCLRLVSVAFSPCWANLAQFFFKSYKKKADLISFNKSDVVLCLSFKQLIDFSNNFRVLWNPKHQNILI